MNLATHSWTMMRKRESDVFGNQINEKYVAEAKMVKLELELGYTDRTSVRFIVVIKKPDIWNQMT